MSSRIPRTLIVLLLVSDISSPDKKRSKRTFPYTCIHLNSFLFPLGDSGLAITSSNQQGVTIKFSRITVVGFISKMYNVGSAMHLKHFYIGDISAQNQTS